MAGLALVVLGFALLVAWFLWAIDSCNRGYLLTEEDS